MGDWTEIAEKELTDLVVGQHHEGLRYVAREAVYEIRQRRAADLSGNDLVTLNGIRSYLKESIDNDGDPTGWRRDAVALLTRMLPGAKP